jgi:hypothetical protein
MNVVFLSPHFPPQFFHFCTALAERGIRVLGVADVEHHQLPGPLKGALADYYRVSSLESYEEVRRALGYFTWRHGRLDRVESHTEYWLGLDAQLREDFNVPGPRPHTMRHQRSKSGMAELFEKAQVPCIEGELVQSASQVRAFARKHGYPLVLKPDTGVGAARTFRVADDAQLEAALEEPLEGYILQPFVRGALYSYDGLVDREGRIVFATAHAFSSGIMEVASAALELHYWSLREIPPRLEALGRRSVEAFGLRERFFHLEFFHLEDGSWKALEMNLRPPGGFTTDLMNWTADVDVYRLWAALVAGDSLADFTYERRFHVAHAARRFGRAYRVPYAQLRERLGPMLLAYLESPRVFAPVLGDEVFIFRHPDLSVVKEMVALIQAPA